MSINRVVISGNLTRDPELRSTPSGSTVLNFGMAVNDRVKNSKTGEWEDYANFVDCVLFGNRAEPMSRIMHKGMKVCVEGRLRYSSWEKDGQRRSKLEVIADNVDLPPKGQSQGQYQQQRQFANQYNQQPQYQQPMQQPMPQQQWSPSPNYPTVQQAQPAQQQYQGYQQQPQMTPDVYDEDIPFSQPSPAM